MAKKKKNKSRTFEQVFGNLNSFAISQDLFWQLFEASGSRFNSRHIDQPPLDTDIMGFTVLWLRANMDEEVQPGFGMAVVGRLFALMKIIPDLPPDLVNETDEHGMFCVAESAVRAAAFTPLLFAGSGGLSVSKFDITDFVTNARKLTIELATTEEFGTA